MQTLRGTGKTFSTSAKRVPWRSNPKVARSIARRNRIKHLFPSSKAEARKLCDAAVAPARTQEPEI